MTNTSSVRRRYTLHDLIEDPNFNPATQNNRGDWSLRDVSTGQVALGDDGKPECIDHGAMNCVNESMTIWRCLMCGRATYATPYCAHTSMTGGWADGDWCCDKCGQVVTDE